MHFFRDVRRYWNYIWYSALSELRAQVQGSYLGWMWWILDPLLFMVVYAFVTIVVFGQSIENFPIFVFLGIVVWEFFSTTVGSSVEVIRSYAAVTQKVYIPKFVIIISKMMVSFIKMSIGLWIVMIAVIVVRIPLSIHLLSAIPLLAVLILLSFGISVLVAHAGVYVSDLSNVMTVVLRFLFYLSGVFYSIQHIPEQWRTIYNFAVPTGFIINQMRAAIMYATAIDYAILAWWFAIGLLVSVAALAIMRKHEKEYMKIG